MNKIYLTIIITTIHLISFGQEKSQNKNERTAKVLVGSWKFDYALYSDIFMGTTLKDKSKIFHTDTLHFFENMTFKFRSHDTANIDIRFHNGVWEIADKGKTLIHKNRGSQPPFVGYTPDFNFSH
jgi:hypothetical protein